MKVVIENQGNCLSRLLLKPGNPEDTVGQLHPDQVSVVGQISRGCPETEPPPTQQSSKEEASVSSRSSEYRKGWTHSLKGTQSQVGFESCPGLEYNNQQDFLPAKRNFLCDFSFFF